MLLIRILHVVASMNRGGIETFLMNLYRNIDREIIQFDFLVHTEEEGDYDSEIREYGGNIYSVSSRSAGLLKNRKELDSFFQKHKEFNIIHQHVSSLSYIEPLKIANKHGVKIRIIHSHNSQQTGSIIHQVLHRINKRSIKTIATDYFSCSKLAAQWMYPNRLINDNKIRLFNNGIEQEQFKYNSEIRQKIRRELNLDDNFVVGHIGRFHPQKNHEFLIDVFYSILKLKNKSKLLLVGDGFLRNSIQNKVRALGLEDKVIFTGVRSDISELLQAMDIFLLPSLYEGLPVVLVEAQASGLKCYTAAEVVTDEVNITGLVQHISLNEPSDFWAETIINNYSSERINTSERIKTAGYDIRQGVEVLQKWYESRLATIF